MRSRMGKTASRQVFDTQYAVKQIHIQDRSAPNDWLTPAVEVHPCARWRPGRGERWQTDKLFGPEAWLNVRNAKVSLNCRPVFVHATIIDSLLGPGDWRSWRRACDRTPCLETGRGYQGYSRRAAQRHVGDKGHSFFHHTAQFDPNNPAPLKLDCGRVPSSRVNFVNRQSFKLGDDHTQGPNL